MSANGQSPFVSAGPYGYVAPVNARMVVKTSAKFEMALMFPGSMSTTDRCATLPTGATTWPPCQVLMAAAASSMLVVPFGGVHSIPSKERIFAPPIGGWRIAALIETCRWKGESYLL